MAAIMAREIAQEARAFRRATGNEVGERGRLSVQAFTAYLLANPQRARVVAAANGLTVSKRGRLSAADAKAVASVLR